MDAALEEKMDQVHWIPLESNPDMLNSFATSIGMPAGYAFTDVFGTDPDLLAMVPQPCVGVTLLFPINAKMAEIKAARTEKVEKDGQKVSPDLFYMKQYVGNACGTIATIHCLGNCAKEMGISAESKVGKFLAQTAGKSDAEIGAALAEASDLHVASEGAAAGGQTDAPEAEAQTDHHFICFVEKDGDCYELDGGKKFAINHGPTEGNLLLKSTQVIKACFMDPQPDVIDFALMALSKVD